MNSPLADALQSIPLEPGHVYRCEVRGHTVEIRMLDLMPEPPSIPESDIMLDAWIEFPEPEGGTLVPCRPGELDLPDPPVIPPDMEPS